MPEIDWRTLFERLDSRPDDYLSKIIADFIPSQHPVVKIRFYQILMGIAPSKLARSSDRGLQPIPEHYAERALRILLERPSAKHICNRLKNILQSPYDRFYQAYKIGRGFPHTNKTFGRSIYANDHGVCSIITFFWLLSTVSWLKLSGLKLRDTFYELLDTFNAHLAGNPQINNSDLVSSALIQHFEPTYLSRILKTPPTLPEEYDLAFLPFWVCAILHTHVRYFEHAIFMILENMLKQNLEQISIYVRLAPVYTSDAPSHSLGMSIEVRKDIIKLLYFDPNDPDGGRNMYIEKRVFDDSAKNKYCLLEPIYREDYLLACFYCLTTDGKRKKLKLPNVFYQSIPAAPLSRDLAITAIKSVSKRRMTATPLMSENIIALLLKARIDLSTETELSAFFLNYCRRVDDEFQFKFFIKLGAIINARDSDGVSPLYGATLADNIKWITICLENGADPNFECSNETPLHLAKSGGIQEVVDLLVRAGGCCRLRDECKKGCPIFC